jgi:hypothetical protein
LDWICRSTKSWWQMRFWAQKWKKQGRGEDR